MALTRTGPISLLDLQNEFGGSGPIGMDEYLRGNGLVPIGTAASDAAFYEYPDGGRAYNVQIPTSGTVQLSEFLGTTAVAPVSNYNYTSPGVYTIPGKPGVSTARITIVGAGGGGGGGGHGGDGDSAGAAGGGGAGGGAGTSKYGIVHFPAGTGLTISVGAPGAGGNSGQDWRFTDGTWLYGANGDKGGDGQVTRVYDVNNNILASVLGGKGGGGGGGGDRTDNVASPGGNGGLPNGGDGQASQYGQGYYRQGYVIPGVGGGGGGPNGGAGGNGGPGAGTIGENGDQSATYRGTAGSNGGSGTAYIEFGESTGAPDIVVSTINVSASGTDEYENTVGMGPAFYYMYFNATVQDGVEPYSYNWVVVDNPQGFAIQNGTTASARMGRRLFGDTTDYWTATLRCDVTDSTGAVASAEATSSYTFEGNS